MKTRTIALVLLLLLATPLASPAILFVDLGDPRANDLTVTYRFTDLQAGSQSMEVLPYDAAIEVLEAAPEKGGTPLRWERINEGMAGKPKIRVAYPQPIAPGGRYDFRLVAKMKDANMYFEDSAKLNFLYRTAHEIAVSLPRGFLPIYTDEAMELKQEKERVVLTSKGGKERPVVIFAIRCDGGKPSAVPRTSPAPETPPPDETE
ncbi:MAG: hypothetical protein FJY73_14380 [Candidatus Eisenbacteria bacterium]|nr:hypothetical protein [Candidatus Eisenbacteria bacterium]